ncbi:uncharacterized protein LOC131025897 [Salvia miltiorrhiza]|uniref:uncharacterized protein LOC131025897 n=1 Tax=Salvia miltiorrhiza TaxID=226208 RepID=UPI0025AC022D|nr:uncharacterized protein LOC131025897 [Salvia miltiorrhiza]
MVQSRAAVSHPSDLEEVFRVIRQNRLMLNPKKCTFGVRTGKFLGYRVTPQGIEVNKDKVHAIINMTPPRNVKESRAAVSHPSDLEEVFRVIRQNRLMLNPKKCTFGVRTGKFLGYRVTPQGIEVNKDKVHAIINMTPPRNVKEGAELNYSELERAVLIVLVTTRRLRPLRLKRNLWQTSYKTTRVEKQIPWRAFVDGSVTKDRCGVGIYIQSPANDDLQFVIKYEQRLSNNEAEYEDVVRALSILSELGAESDCIVEQIPREQNNRADLLARMANVVKHSWTDSVTLLFEPSTENKQGIFSLELYKRSFTHPLLECLSPEEAHFVLRKVHQGYCGNDARYKDLMRKIVRAGFYWPTLAEDAKQFVKKCEIFQKYALCINIPRETMGAMYATCPFDKWGIDIVGKLPTAPGGRCFLIVAVDYFSKWVEAEAVTKIDECTIERFLWRNI